MGIFNLDVGSIFNKKNNTTLQKNKELDPESIELINSTPVEGMHIDPVPEKKVSVNKKDLPTQVSPKENSPFAIDTNQIPELAKEPPLEEKPPAKQIEKPEPEEKDLFALENKFQRPEIIEEKQPKIDSTASIPKEKNTQPTPNKNFGAGKIIALVLSIVIILTLAGGAYYFFFYKVTETAPVNVPKIIQPKIEIPVVENNPKYLNLDFETSASSENAIKKMQNYISEFKKEGNLKSIEYVIADLKNNPETFTNFTDRLGLAMPDSFLSLIGRGMRFFIVNDNGNTGIGMILESKDDILLKEELLKLEADSFKYVSLILPNTEIEAPLDPIIFKKTTYRGVENRYFNVVSPFELSIDYIISKNKLFIGTTQMTIQKIYDLIEEESNITEEISIPTISDDETLTE